MFTILIFKILLLLTKKVLTPIALSSIKHRNNTLISSLLLTTVSLPFEHPAFYTD